MISYVTVGADDITAAKRFYGAFLPALGYGLEEGPEGLSYALPDAPDQSIVLPEFYVKPTYDGRPASAGNGSMVARSEDTRLHSSHPSRSRMPSSAWFWALVAFELRNQAEVRALHAAALAAGGSDEGQPGFRADYGPKFYVGYLRDPQGNKIALFSSNPNEPGRDG